MSEITLEAPVARAPTYCELNFGRCLTDQEAAILAIELREFNFKKDTPRQRERWERYQRTLAKRGGRSKAHWQSGWYPPQDPIPEGMEPFPTPGDV